MSLLYFRLKFTLFLSLSFIFIRLNSKKNDTSSLIPDRVLKTFSKNNLRKTYTHFHLPSSFNEPCNINSLWKTRNYASVVIIFLRYSQIVAQQRNDRFNSVYPAASWCAFCSHRIYRSRVRSISMFHCTKALGYLSLFLFRIFPIVRIR